MAASRRSPLMRDQWRADDDDRHHAHRIGKERSHRTTHSPAPRSRHPEAADSGLRIKGRAVGETAARKSSPAVEQSKSSRRTEEVKGHHPSSSQAHSAKPKRDLADDRPSDRHTLRETRLRSPSRRRRTRSPTPERKSHTATRHRRKERSPAQPSSDLEKERKDKHRISEKRLTERARDKSPYRKRSYSPERLASDSYIPSSQRRRSRSPGPRHRYLEDSHRRRSRSPVRHSKYRDEDYSSSRRDRDTSPRRRRSPVPSDRYDYRRRAASPDRRRPALDNRRRSRSPLPRARERARHSSPKRSYRSRSRSRDRGYKRDRMNHSTRPIQSILDDPPRRHTPPRRIPSFDDVHGGNTSHHGQQFNMHGGKPDRRHPPNIDTRQSYATSPQYMTPTSSHHATPHSGSPYNQGRGGWQGQQQYYQSQPA